VLDHHVQCFVYVMGVFRGNFSGLQTVTDQNLSDNSLLGLCWLQHNWLFRRRSRSALMHGRTQAAPQARKHDQLPPHKTLQEINPTKEEINDPDDNSPRYNYELDIAPEALYWRVCG